MIGADVIKIDTDLCLNQRIRDAGCQLCANICAKQAIVVDDAGQPRLNGECISCGLCMLVCPSQAIQWMQTVRYPLTQIDGTADVYCTKMKCDGYVPCLANLAVEELVYLALKTKVNLCIDQKVCVSCNRDIYTYVQQNVEKANQFLAKLQVKPIQYKFKQQEQTAQINRRELFSFFFTKMKQSIAQALPIETEASNYRKMLVRELQTKSVLQDDNAAPLFSGIKQIADCTMCGACERSCRNQALKIVWQEEQNVVQLKHDEARCMGCGVCMKICPEKVLDVSMENSHLAMLCQGSQQVVATKILKTCTKCGKKIIEDGANICKECERKAHISLQDIY